MCRRARPRGCVPRRQVKALGFESSLAIMLAKQCREHGAGDGRDVQNATEPRNDSLRTDGRNHDGKTMGFEENHFRGTCRKPSQKMSPNPPEAAGELWVTPPHTHTHTSWGSHYIRVPPLHLRGHPGMPRHVTSSRKTRWGARPPACQPRALAPLELLK